MINHSHDVSATPVAGPVLAGLLSPASADEVLRVAFAEADRRGVPLTVRITASLARNAIVSESIDRWAEKFPHVALVVSASQLDPAITLSAATGGSCLAVLPTPAGTFESALLRAVVRRSRCPVLTAARHADPCQGGHVDDDRQGVPADAPGRPDAGCGHPAPGSHWRSAS